MNRFLCVALILASTVSTQTKAPSARGAALASLVAYREAIDANLLDVAGDALDAARKAARKAKSWQLVAEVEARVADLHLLQHEWKRISELDQTALATRTALGRYHALYRGAFDVALPHMLAGDGVAWKALAVAASGVVADDPDALCGLARMWLAQAPTTGHGLLVRNVRLHARSLYERAWACAQPPARPDIADRVFRLSLQLLPEDGLGFVEFRRSNALDAWIRTGGKWTIKQKELRARDDGDRSRATYRFAFSKFRCARIRGRITSANNQNFRFSVGPINAILNWEGADQNHYRYIDRVKDEIAGHVLTPDQDHDITVLCIGEHVMLYVDERAVWQTEGPLAGTVTVYPAFGSIAVSSVAIDGVLDGSVVTEPSHRSH